MFVYIFSNLNFFKFQNGARPIHYAAIQNKIETLFKFEELGADICAKDKVISLYFIVNILYGTFYLFSVVIYLEIK